MHEPGGVNIYFGIKEERGRRKEERGGCAFGQKLSKMREASSLEKEERVGCVFGQKLSKMRGASSF
ncbi:MAG TPA: hypothetical protein VF883_23160, partial [Thermoanaerobaculia bacterium]